VVLILAGISIEKVWALRIEHAIINPECMVWDGENSTTLGDLLGNVQNGVPSVLVFSGG